MENINVIEEELNQGSNFKEIASILNKNPLTISNEIQRNFTILNLLPLIIPLINENINVLVNYKTYAAKFVAFSVKNAINTMNYVIALSMKKVTKN